MNSTQSKVGIQDLYKQAIPIQNMPNIGTIDYLGYQTLIIINDFERKQGKEIIQFKKGWINLTKFQSDFIDKTKAENPNIENECKPIRNWGLTKANKEIIEKVKSYCTNSCSIKAAFLGNNNTQIDCKGTYFHPELVLDVLRDTNPKMKEIMDQIINEVIMKTNIALKQDHEDTLEKFKEHLQTLSSPTDKSNAILERIAKLEHKKAQTDVLLTKYIISEELLQLGQLELQSVIVARNQAQEAQRMAEQKAETDRLAKEDALKEMQKALAQLNIYGDVYQIQKKESSLSLLKEECAKCNKPFNKRPGVTQCKDCRK